jgi:hypothetical protein
MIIHNPLIRLIDKSPNHALECMSELHSTELRPEQLAGAFLLDRF